MRLQPFVDGHVHLREPGINKAETIASGTLAAAYGGVGAVVDMSNNPGRPTLDMERVEEKRDISERDAWVHVGTAGGAQPEFNNRSQLRIMLPRLAQVKLYGGPTTGVERKTDYEAYEFDDNLDEIALTGPDTLVVFHSGKHNYRDFIGHAAQDRGLRVRIAHINKMDQVKAVKEARAKGLDVRGAITPQTLLLTSNDLRTRSAFADMQPPLVGQSEGDELFDALVNADIQEIETDHAPHTHEAKWKAINANPACEESDHGSRCCGVPALEFCGPLLLWQVHIGRLSLRRLVEAYTEIPADSLRLKIRPDSYVDWDMTPYRINDEAMQVRSNAGWTPFLGMMAMGHVNEMQVGSVRVIKDGEPYERVRSFITPGAEI